MKDRLFFWMGGVLLHFGIAKYIADKSDCELYGIFDVDIVHKKFFENQNITKFQKVWFYRDHVDLDPYRKPDVQYLQKFEEKYQIPLWHVAYSERSFYKFNPYHQFSHDEILSILEQECKLFEKALDESNPNFLLIGTTDSHHNDLLYRICKARGIKTLAMGAARFGYKEIVSWEVDRFDKIVEPIEVNYSKNEKTFQELQGFLHKFDFTKQFTDLKKKMKFTPSMRIKKFFKITFVYSGKKFRNHYVRVGMTRSKTLYKLPLIHLRKIIWRNFIEKISIKNLGNEPFIYYPLHSEPERALSIAAPYYTNQIEVITHIAKSIPVGYKLYVKDHPSMSLKGERSSSFYKEIMKLPNVVLLHPKIKRDDILEKCKMVITIAGTTGLEALFFNKPAIIFAETLFSHLPSIRKIEKLEELPEAIRELLKVKVNPNDLNKFIQFINANSFEVNRKPLSPDFRSRFQYKEILKSEMLSYLADHKNVFTVIADEYLKKIKKINEKQK